jgi:hypothetical protein
MFKGIQFVAAAFILGAAVCGSFAQNLIIDGPGEVLFPGQKRTPFSTSFRMDFPSNQTSLNQSLNVVPAGKIFVCTNASVQFLASSPNMSYLSKFLMQFWNSTGESPIGRLCGARTNENGLDESPWYAQNFQTLMYFKNTSDTDIHISCNKDPRASLTYITGNLSGYLIDE